jgi:hypothetical protein
MGPWLKQQHVVLIDDYASQKQAAFNAVTAEKIRILLTQQSDLLSNAQLGQLTNIAALLP